MKTNMMKGQQGFTLIEIAIVLVIIGLLLGGVLQGQQLIQNSRVRSMINEINGISAAVTGYQDRYGRLPGDDGNLVALQGRGGVWVAATGPTVAGNLSGAINTGPAITGGTFYTTPTLEALGFWQHLRAAGFINGDPSAVGAGTTPVSPWGGGITVTGLAANGVPIGVAKLCFNNVPGSAAQTIDTRLDDGANETGRVRSVTTANPAAATPAAAPYAEDITYAMCVSI